MGSGPSVGREKRKEKKITNFAYAEKGVWEEEKPVIVSFGEIFT